MKPFMIKDELKKISSPHWKISLFSLSLHQLALLLLSFILCVVAPIYSSLWQAGVGAVLLLLLSSQKRGGGDEERAPPQIVLPSLTALNPGLSVRTVLRHFLLRGHAPWCLSICRSVVRPEPGLVLSQNPETFWSETCLSPDEDTEGV